LQYDTARDTEYFLVENRSQVDLDASLPDGGLAVYHCDTQGSNEWQDGTPDRHYQCALLQADGERELERNVNRGDAEDLYDRTIGVAIADATNPSSKMWDRSDSGLVLSDIGRPGQRILFKSGAPDQPPRLRKDVRAHLIIPDNDPQGVRSSLTVEESGKLRWIRVGTDISHTYRGDLTVDLQSPSGESVTLHREEGGPLDNLLLDLNSDNNEILRAFLDESISGQWTLTVRDTLPDDSGRLNSWFLELDFEDTRSQASGQATPNASIPDADPAGVSSSIQIDDEGDLQDIAVDVEITHTYRGDLQIELIAPDGRAALLREPSIDSRPGIKETFTMASTASLRAFAGTSIRGAWHLQVRDLATIDTGTLRNWTLRVTY